MFNMIRPQGSTDLNHDEMQYTPVRMATTKQTGRTGVSEHVRAQAGQWNGTTTVDEFASFLTKRSAILLLGIYPREVKVYVYTQMCARMFVETLFVHSQKAETTQISINRWSCGISKQWNVFQQ